MELLKAVPTTRHLERIYYELARIGASSVGAKRSWPYNISSDEELIALACEMSRFDPRLFDILTLYFISHWRDLNPLRLRGFYAGMKSPQTVAVIAEFLNESSDDPEVKCFSSYLAMGLSKSAPQFYFYNLYSPGGSLARRAVEEGLYEFKKWGFFALQRPIIAKENRQTAGLLDTTARRNILRRLLEEKKEINLKDYLSAVNNSISRQQALLDIKSSGYFQVVGRGRGARWRTAA